MRDIAVISRYFAPENEVAAIRPTKLIKYLKRSNEYSFTVITTEKSFDMTKDGLLERDLKYADQVIHISDENAISRLLGRIIQSMKKKYGGVSAARNAGLEQARGEYIAFVDGDDWCESDYLECLFSNLLQNQADWQFAAISKKIRLVN